MSTAAYKSTKRLSFDLTDGFFRQSYSSFININGVDRVDAFDILWLVQLDFVIFILVHMESC